MASFQEQLNPDEYIISMPFYEQSARERSMELVMGVREQVGRLGMVA
jgi:hypothetical protein